MPGLQTQGKVPYRVLKQRMSGSSGGGEDGVEDESKLDPKAKANQSIRWYETERMQPGAFADVEEDYGEECPRQARTPPLPPPPLFLNAAPLTPLAKSLR